MMINQTTLWIAFAIVIGIAFIIDLSIGNKKTSAPSFKEALILTIVWILFALAFNLGIYYFEGMQKGTQFLTGYIVEQSLSIDNLFVFLMIFTQFSVPSQYQHRVLLYGVIGAIILRGIFIFVGLALLKKYFWIMYIFAAFLIFTGIKMLLTQDKETDITQNPIVLYLRKHFRITPNYHENHFWLKINKQLWITPLFLVLVLFVISDIIFAVDSIPAVIAITQDPFIVYTSNIFAILGLRSLFFVLATTANKFHYLKTGVSIIILFIGCKMAVAHYYPIPTFISLVFIITTLILSVIVSLLKKQNNSTNSPIIKQEQPKTKSITK